MEENAQDGKMPSIESIMKAIENMPDIPEEDKKQLIANLLQRQELGDDAPFASLNKENIENVVGGATNTFLDVAILLSLISIVFLVLGKPEQILTS